jgi:hypothetical protein
MKKLKQSLFTLLIAGVMALAGACELPKKESSSTPPASQTESIPLPSSPNSEEESVEESLEKSETESSSGGAFELPEDTFD